jgi:glutathione S-transferase
MAQIPFEEILIALDTAETSAEIAKYTRAGLVPILIDGDLTVWDSLAIIEYAHDLYPNAGIWPATRSDRAQARSVSAEMHSGFYPLRKTMPMAFCEDRTPHTPAPQAATNIARIIAVWDEALDTQPAGGPFLFGKFCAADAMFAPVVSRFRTYGIPLSGRAKAYADAIWDLAPVHEWQEGAKAEVG